MTQNDIDFYNFVKSELGDVVVFGCHSQKILAYAYCWVWSKHHDTFCELLSGLDIDRANHSTYQMADGSLFVVDRTKQYEKIYNHRWNKWFWLYNTCMTKQNWFSTLNEALEAENLLEAWDCFWMPIVYGETRVFYTENERVSIYRETDGRYERPIHYKCKVPKWVKLN